MFGIQQVSYCNSLIQILFIPPKLKSGHQYHTNWDFESPTARWYRNITVCIALNSGKLLLIHQGKLNYNQTKKATYYLPRIGMQIRKASPVVLSGHVQIGMWLDTVQTADTPHVPGQGSWHLLRMHAWFIGQSELTRHSGRQTSYGFPWYSGMHSHMANEFSTRQWALDPHGDG